MAKLAAKTKRSLLFILWARDGLIYLLAPAPWLKTCAQGRRDINNLRLSEKTCIMACVSRAMCPASAGGKVLGNPQREEPTDLSQVSFKGFATLSGRCEGTWLREGAL